MNNAKYHALEERFPQVLSIATFTPIQLPYIEELDIPQPSLLQEPYKKPEVIDCSLEFTNTQIRGLMKETGYNMIEAAPSVELLRDMNFLEALLFWGLTKHHPMLTRESVPDLISINRFGYIVSRLRKAIDVFYPDLSDIPDDPAGQVKVLDTKPNPTGTDASQKESGSDTGQSGSVLG